MSNLKAAESVPPATIQDLCPLSVYSLYHTASCLFREALALFLSRLRSVLRPSFRGLLSILAVCLWCHAVAYPCSLAPESMVVIKGRPILHLASLNLTCTSTVGQARLLLSPLPLLFTFKFRLNYTYMLFASISITKICCDLKHMSLSNSKIEETLVYIERCISQNRPLKLYVKSLTSLINKNIIFRITLEEFILYFKVGP